MIIAALLLIAKLTQAYLEEKARKDAYNNAVTLMEDGKYDEAIEEFKALEGYEDSETMITEAENRKAYAAAEELLATGKLEEAKTAFEKLGDFSDSKKRVEEIIEQQNANAYAAAEKLLAEGKYDEAIKRFQELGNYSDSAKRVEEAKTAKKASLYKQAAEYAEKEEYRKRLIFLKSSEAIRIQPPKQRRCRNCTTSRNMRRRKNSWMKGIIRLPSQNLKGLVITRILVTELRRPKRLRRNRKSRKKFGKAGVNRNLSHQKPEAFMCLHLNGVMEQLNRRSILKTELVSII